MLPNFFCIGAAKAGTTTLHDILTQHTDIYLPRVKETKYFTVLFDKGLKWYESEFFKNWDGESAVGEIFPCLDHADVPKRLYDSLGPDLKIIVMLRNPVDRAYSNYLMLKTRGRTELSFEEALQDLSPSLVDKGLYGKYIKNFLEYFPLEQMKFVLFETDFLNDCLATIMEVQQFVGVEPRKLNVDLKSNPLSQPRNRMIHDLIYKRSAIVNKLGRILIPSHEKRVALRKFIGRLNAVAQKPPKLSLVIRNKILNEYFMEDICILEGKIRRDLSVWYKDSSE